MGAEVATEVNLNVNARKQNALDDIDLYREKLSSRLFLHFASVSHHQCWLSWTHHESDLWTGDEMFLKT